VKDDQVYLLHIRDAAARILSYTAEGQAMFIADVRTQGRDSAAQAGCRGTARIDVSGHAPRETVR